MYYREMQPDSDKIWCVITFARTINVICGPRLESLTRSRSKFKLPDTFSKSVSRHVMLHWLFTSTSKRASKTRLRRMKYEPMSLFACIDKRNWQKYMKTFNRSLVTKTLTYNLMIELSELADVCRNFLVNLTEANGFIMCANVRFNFWWMQAMNYILLYQ